MSPSVRFQSAFTSPATCLPPPRLLPVTTPPHFPSLHLTYPSSLQFTSYPLLPFPIPVSILPCPFSCNPSVISLCVFMKYVCFGKYGFMHACMLGCIAVCNEQAGANHYANETISHSIPNLH